MQYCRYDKQGHVVTITINRPEVMNSLHKPANDELHEAWNTFAEDDDAWVAVLTGAGERAFSAGNDLKYTAEMSRLPRDQRPDMSFPPSGFGGITARYNLFKPVIARVNGFALGGGLEMALACDIIVAAEHAQLGLPEPRRGLIAAAGGVHRLPRQVPQKLALGHMLTGRPIPAPRAAGMGLVNEVVPASRLDEAVAAWVEDILKCAPLSVRATKEAALSAIHLDLPGALAGTYEWEQRRRGSADATEGPRAFAEKRDPIWKGA